VKRKTFILILMTLVLSILTILPVSANQLTFGVQANLPENQVDNKVTYFDLKLNPGASQTVTVTVTNGTKKQVKIKPEVNTATTNLNGVVEYQKVSAKNFDSSLKYPLSKYVTPVEKTIVLNAKQSKKIHFKIKMPKGKFNGVMAGGIRLQDENAEISKDAKKKKGTTVQNEYAYLVGIVLQQTAKKVTPDMKLASVKPSQNNLRNVINSRLRNVKATYLNKLSVNAKVSKAGSSKILYHQKTSNMQMAPNSVFNYALNLNGQKLKAGTYVMDITAKSKKQTWHFKKQFTITRKKAAVLNAKDVSIKKNYSWIYISVGVLILLIMIAIAFWLIRRKLKAKEAENEALRAQLEKHSSDN
jgi:biopolymer transport protein ExbD